MNLSDERPLGSSPAAPETAAAPELGATPETVVASEMTIEPETEAREATFVAPEAGAAFVASAPEETQQEAPLVPEDEAPGLGRRPSFFFLGIVSSLTLFADISTKGWAEVALNRRGFEPIEVIDGYLSIILAYNRGGAWGLLQNASEFLRKPFFLGVSVMAIVFIVSLYSKLHRSQRALTWGLPLVLGGALGNLSDRITRSQVVDFIDYRSDWVLSANLFVQKYVKSWSVTDHWPTFNVADIAICVGVILMAIDMITTRRPLPGEPRPALGSGVPAPTPSSFG